jgi:UDP-N-acetylglucosamine--N-acetylmuramyl-(pentapeptide) pyrophosphoryl-undecaprenol N-acetylglucosamine transferase
MTILFAAGGTGGHVYPAIAIAEEIKKQAPEVRIVFAGTKEKIEARVVPEKGFEFVTLWISGFSRRLRVSNLLFPLKVIVSLIQSFFVIWKLKPHVAIGTGGYVCGPVLFAASMLKIPAIVHESNSYPGVTTRMLASRVTKVFIAFETTKRWLPSTAAVELVGNPTREELSTVSHEAGCEYFTLDPQKKTIFAFGGSLGSASLNAAMPGVIEEAVKNDLQVIWQTGEHQNEFMQKYSKQSLVRIRKYLERIEFAYAAADLVISRAGATTLAELTRLGKPAILVPYPFAAANHQELNAQTMLEAGAAVVLHDNELKEKLSETVKALLFDYRRLEEMKAKSIMLGKPTAGKDIAEKVLHLISHYASGI